MLLDCEKNRRLFLPCIVETMVFYKGRCRWDRLSARACGSMKIASQWRATVAVAAPFVHKTKLDVPDAMHAAPLLLSAPKVE